MSSGKRDWIVIIHLLSNLYVQGNLIGTIGFWYDGLIGYDYMSGNIFSVVSAIAVIILDLFLSICLLRRMEAGEIDRRLHLRGIMVAAPCIVLFIYWLAADSRFDPLFSKFAWFAIAAELGLILERILLCRYKGKREA